MTGRSESHGVEPEPKQPEDAVESVSGYRDLARIGHGGFSVVYRAVQESFERDVALKILNVGPDEDARRRFLREVRLASKLSGHPHVVTVLDTGTTEAGRPYLAMDLYDGGSMKERVRRSGPLSAAETAVLGAKIGEALAAAHSLGVLHRDVKPNNILVSKFGEPALADFGVSCLLDSSSSASVLDVFSPQHAAPELMTRGVPTKASDVYALGSTLYELLTGRPPFGADSRDVRSLMWRAMTEPAPRPDCPELPELADAIVKALAKEPDERFPDAAEFAQTLRALIPEGASSVLAMSGATLAGVGATAVIAVGAAELAGASSASVTSGGTSGPFDDLAETSVRGESLGDHTFDPDSTSGGRLRGVDETMVRPDRIDPVLPPSKGKDRDGRRSRKPLIFIAVFGLLGAAVWAVIESQGHATTATAAGPTSSASATVAASASASASATKATPSATPSATHSAVAVVETTAEASKSAKPTPTAAHSSSGSQLGLTGSYTRYQNAQSGECLAASGSPTQQSCASTQSQGWATSVPVTGLLGAVAGEFELVNESSGDCLAVSGGSIETQSCTDDSAQEWTKVAGSSGEEFRNSDAGLCLTSSGGGVSAGSCSLSDKADLWSED